MKSSKLKTEKAFWIRTETRHGEANQIECPDQPSMQVYKARLNTCDARLAEALSQVPEVDPLQILRTRIMRGQYSEARSILEKIRADGGDKYEICLEESRLNVFSGQWQAGADWASIALEEYAPAPTRITLLNIRSVAFFELGRFREALQDCDQIQSLGKLLPHLPASFFGRILKARIDLRSQPLIRAEESLKRVWNNSSYINADFMIALLRAEIDFCRWTGRDIVPYALACFALATETGDDLYRALALVDLFSAANDELKSELQSELQLEIDRFDRARILFDEAFSAPHKVAHTSAAAVRLTRPSLDRETWNRRDSVDSIVLPELKRVIRLKPFEVLHLPKLTQVFEAVEILSSGPQTSERFFSSLWNQKYVPHLHHGLVRTLLTRLRQNLKLTIVTENKLIHLKNTMVAR